MKADSVTLGRERCTGAGARQGSGQSLPVIGGGGVSIKKSTRSKWRAAVLILVHVLIIGHVIHYVVAGETLSPVEPSESMFTLELGLVNAGAIFFATALAATLVFGRFFCGWGCHLVAYQDLCAWIMKKFGVKPKPFRSRLLVYVPLALALYMFVWPSVKRFVPGWSRSFPGFSNHLMTTEFWATFPGPVFAVLSILICGFAAVYFLGAKGFCTYGCPYGGFFGLLDRYSAGRILVTDACEQCGHCTATCTSNVRVHEEVRLYGMVVDPGCMKCNDCISVCPNNALYFGFATPAALHRKATGAPSAKQYDFTRGEEFALVAFFLAATLSFRGLYDGPPLLLSVGLGGITAYLALKTSRVLRDPTVRLQNLRIKSAGRLGVSGWVFSIGAAGWLAFTIHSGFVQWHRAWGVHHLNRTEATEAEVFAAAFDAVEYSPQHADAAEKSSRHFSIADRWGLFDVVEIKLGRAWMHLLDGDDARAERHVEEAIAVDPNSPKLYEHLAKIHLRQQRPAEAIDVLMRRLQVGEPVAADHLLIAGLLLQENRVAEAIEQYQSCLALDGEFAPAHYNLGGVLGRMGRFDEAIEHLAEARRLMPADVDTHIELGVAYSVVGRVDEAAASFRRAIELAPENPEPRMHLERLLRGVEGTRGR